MFKKTFFAIKRHKVFGVIILAVMGVGAYLFFGRASGDPLQTAYTYGKVSKGTVMQTVSGTGQIEAFRQTDITSEVSGKAVVEVAAGQQVRAGDVIARIDDNDGQDAVADAKIALYNAQLALDDITEPAGEIELAKARNLVIQAQKTLENDNTELDQSYEQGFNTISAAFNDLPQVISFLQEIATEANDYVVQSSSTYLDYYYNSAKKYDPEAASLMTKAASTWRQAKAKYDTNFEHYKDTSRFSDTEDIEALLDETYGTVRAVSDALKNLANVIQNYEDNLNDRNMEPQEFAGIQLGQLSDYMSTNSSNLSSLLSAAASIDNAKNAIDTDKLSFEEYQKELEELQKGADEGDIQSAKYAVEQKARALADAQKKLKEYTIIAPFDGTIASVEIENGEDVKSGASIATVITDAQGVTVSLNEVDIAKVEVGQQATLTFDAISDLTMTGKVVEVATIGTVDSGVVNYEVTIALDSANEQVKPGMSTTANIITDIAQDVLTVPAGAIRAANGGTQYVLVPAAESSIGQQEPSMLQKTVTTGLDDGVSVQIKSGLEEGEMVAVAAVQPTTVKSSDGSNSRGFMMMGGPRD